MSMYGTVPQTDSSGARSPTIPAPKFLLSFLEGSTEDSALADRENHPERGLGNTSSFITFKINPESCRFVAYIFFSSMSIFAILVTHFVVRPALLKGSPNGSTCPPFDPIGEGFDIALNSHLTRHFGYNNICSNWDYSPSRELTAMVYPLFEYSLLMYLIVDFANFALAYKKGYVGKSFWLAVRIMFPIQLVLCAWFRMIFVVIAYVDVQGHTAGFLGLQVALIMVACQNTFYVLETRVAYSFLGGLRNTRRVAYTYLIGDLIIGMLKIYCSIYIVSHGASPPFTLLSSGVGSKNIGQMIDLVWMVFNAMIPLFISYARSKSEKPLVFTIDYPVNTVGRTV